MKYNEGEGGIEDDVDAIHFNPVPLPFQNGGCSNFIYGWKTCTPVNVGA
jgi:hypothetical protein